MELKKIEGIVLYEMPYKESSKIIKIFTKDDGLISAIAKGSKRLKSNLRSVTDKLTYANFEISYKKDGLSTLISADVINPFINIKKDIVKISYSNYLLELTSQVIKQSMNNNIYNLLISSLLKINDGYDPMVITNILELKYLDYLGVTPNLDGCAICGSKDVVTLSASAGGFVCNKHLKNDYIVTDKTIKIIRMLRYLDIDKISKIDLSSNIKNEINNFIDDYYDRYTGLFMKSKEFIKDVEKLN